MQAPLQLVNSCLMFFVTLLLLLLLLLELMLLMLHLDNHALRFGHCSIRCVSCSKFSRHKIPLETHINPKIWKYR